MDLCDLMVKPTPVEPLSAKPVELFRQARRPKITRLAESDPMPPPPANRSWDEALANLDDLIKTHEAEADLRAFEVLPYAKSVNGPRISVEMKAYEKCKLWRRRTWS